MPYAKFITGAPIWVWPVLLLLLVIGFRACKPRETPVFLIYILPLLGLISLKGIGNLPQPLLAWGCFGAGYAIGAFWGYSLQKKWLLDKKGKTVFVAGEWFTLLVMMILFWTNFVGGVVKAINIDMYSSAGFMGLFAIAVGTASGSFLGRAIRVART